MKERKKSKYAGKTVTIKHGDLAGQEYRVEDWWDRLTGSSWMWAQGNPACIQYALRTVGHFRVPTDDDVLYGKIGAIGHLVHLTEIEDTPSKE